MKTRRSTNILAAVALLGLALTMVIGKLRQHGQDDDHEKLTAESSESSRSSGDHGQSSQSTRRHDRSSSVESSQAARRVLSWDWSDLRPLDWSLEELDFYISKEVDKYTDYEKVHMMLRLFPLTGEVPEGLNLNRMPPGSISLTDQMNLFEKYSDIQYMPVFLAQLWARYRKPELLDDYYIEVVHRLPLGEMRTLEVVNVYREHFKDVDTLASYLNSDALIEHKSNESNTRLGPNSDYKGMVLAVKSRIMDALEEGGITRDQAIEMITASGIDDHNKDGIIFSINHKVERLIQSDIIKD